MCECAFRFYHGQIWRRSARWRTGRYARRCTQLCRLHRASHRAAHRPPSGAPRAPQSAEERQALELRDAIDAAAASGAVNDAAWERAMTLKDVVALRSAQQDLMTYVCVRGGRTLGCLFIYLLTGSSDTAHSVTARYHKTQRTINSIVCLHAAEPGSRMQEPARRGTYYPRLGLHVYAPLPTAPVVGDAAKRTCERVLQGQGSAHAPVFCRISGWVGSRESGRRET